MFVKRKTVRRHRLPPQMTSQRSPLPAPQFGKSYDIMNQQCVNALIPVSCTCGTILARQGLILAFLQQTALPENEHVPHGILLKQLGLPRRCCVSHFVSGLFTRHA